jgi:hypothetical protein
MKLVCAVTVPTKEFAGMPGPETGLPVSATTMLESVITEEDGE